jgi:hypothetical protein
LAKGKLAICGNNYFRKDIFSSNDLKKILETKLPKQTIFLKTHQKQYVKNYLENTSTAKHIRKRHTQNVEKKISKENFKSIAYFKKHTRNNVKKEVGNIVKKLNPGF